MDYETKRAGTSFDCQQRSPDSVSALVPQTCYTYIDNAQLLDEFEDVSLEEKEFMKKWNRHVKEFKCVLTP